MAGPPSRRAAAGALPAARPERRRHDLAASDVDRAVRRAAGAGGGDAAGPPQLLRRPGVGGRYWTFLSEELPALVGAFFRVSTRREDTFVAGLSMGGYGALKWALRQPERFAAAASLSGALHLERLRTLPARPEDPELYTRVFGDHPVGDTPDDLLWLVGQADPARLPALWVGCGPEDLLLDSPTCSSSRPSPPQGST